MSIVAARKKLKSSDESGFQAIKEFRDYMNSHLALFAKVTVKTALTEYRECKYNVVLSVIMREQASMVWILFLATIC